MIIFGTSCGMANLAPIKGLVEFEGVTNVELKGLSGIEITAKVKNNSEVELLLREGKITLRIDGSKAATLIQVGEIVSHPKSDEELMTLWRIEDIDPISMMALTARLMARDFTGMVASCSVYAQVDGAGTTISMRDIDLAQIMTIFAE